MTNDKTIERALLYARSILIEQRLDEWESYTIPPHADTPAAWRAMQDNERKAIRRLDRAVGHIDAAIRSIRTGNMA